MPVSFVNHSLFSQPIFNCTHHRRESLFFVSCVPWLSYTSIIQPVPAPADSNPRITWGKYFRQGEQTLMPVTLLAHHALVDGIHIARFYEALDRELAAIASGKKT